MKGEVQFIKKQIFGGFSREDTVAYVAKIAEERNDEREANIKANEEITALASEISRLKEELEERKNTVSKLEDHIAQSIIIKVVADKDTVIADNAVKAKDEIGDDIPEFEYDPNWHKKYEGEHNEKTAQKLRVKLKR